MAETLKRLTPMWRSERAALKWGLSNPSIAEKWQKYNQVGRPFSPMTRLESGWLSTLGGTS